MLFGLVLFLSHSFFSPFFPNSAGWKQDPHIYSTASFSRPTLTTEWWTKDLFLSLVSFGMRKRVGMPKLLRDLVIPRIVTQSSPRFSQVFIRLPGLVLRLSIVAPQNQRNSKAEGEFATVKFRSLPVVDGNRAGTPHEIQTLGHATIPPTSWALTNGYFHRRCRAEAYPGIGLPALVRKLEKVEEGKRRDRERGRGEEENKAGHVYRYHIEP
ncbi:uncharacterized protein BO88DRAFT_423221 [Aspergillus vadensis CBS 113365]|uniref:Uncharacterized protein n=1 Tax=Aspergillus vadensis (strain CBS 113365 / IMI 142717 / IBT 24658) TaxID=1448311 RepID=A0A319CAL0_ASPVC|nr:hypothetical protein BO88DRAFT_423221 [Aspergillus vadensis CBS 113365]PYH72408.1 hypothetical protein BO88DRAFT_423221 [Aspergillus vadensis CBS 113365]